jgi:uncharacterized RDD family membrane protein YckC
MPGQTGYGAPVPGAKAAYTADGVPLAGWWWRVLAIVVDSVLVGLIAALPSIGIWARLFEQISVVFSEALRAAESGLPAPVTPTAADLLSASDRLFLALVGLIVALAYNILFLRWKAATPGKLLCGLRVVPTDYGHNQAALPWRTVLTRVGVWLLPQIFSWSAILQFVAWLVRLVDVFFPLWQPKRQALHDIAARTQVVRRV